MAAALSAVVVATWQVRAAARGTERSNAIPVLSEISREIRSAEFHDSIFYLLKTLPNTRVPAGGFEDFTEECRQHAYRVCYFFDYLGLLANKGIISENTIISWLGTRIMQVWVVMAPFIKAEREHRVHVCDDGTPPGFVPYFEHLVRRIVEKGGVEAAAKIQRDSGVRRADDLEFPDAGPDGLLIPGLPPSLPAPQPSASP